MRKDLLEFMNKRTVHIVTKTGTCWTYIGMLRGGYGRVPIEAYRNAPKVDIHRLSAHLYHGLDLEDKTKLALHKESICKYKSCWNPEHIYVGSYSDNLHNVLNREGGRDSRPKRTHCSKGHELTEDNIYKIEFKGHINIQCRICSKKQALASYYRRKRRDPKNNA